MIISNLFYNFAALDSFAQSMDKLLEGNDATKNKRLNCFLINKVW